MVTHLRACQCMSACLRRLSRISHLQRVTNTEVLRRTNQTQLSTVLCHRRLFRHVARSDAWIDHSRALRAVISGGGDELRKTLETEQEQEQEQEEQKKDKDKKKNNNYTMSQKTGHTIVTIARGILLDFR